MKAVSEMIDLFLGGGVTLLEGDEMRLGYRRLVDDVVSRLNSQNKTTHRMFIVNTFADITRYAVKERKQDVYNTYIRKEADIAIFILDGAIGDRTKEEIVNAYDSYCKTNHPIIYIYGTNLSDNSDNVRYLNSISQYYHHFTSEDNLKLQLTNDLVFFKPSQQTNNNADVFFQGTSQTTFNMDRQNNRDLNVTQINNTYNTVLKDVPSSVSGHYVVPNGIQIIETNAFRGCNNLFSISIPDSVKCIGDYAFYGCDKLTGISMPDSVTRVGKYAFSNCSSLGAIVIPPYIESVGSKAFMNCRNINRITIRSKRAIIASDAFEGCNNISQIIVPQGTNIYYKELLPSLRKIIRS